MELGNRVHTMASRTERGAWARTEADRPLAGIPASEVEQVCTYRVLRVIGFWDMMGV